MQPKFFNIALSTIILACVFQSQLVAEEKVPAAGNYKQIFRVSPLKAYKYACALRNYPNKPNFKDDELALLEDALDGKLDDVSFDDAMLTVAGVTDARKRENYKLQINGMYEKCKTATADIESPEKQGEEILRYLLLGPLKPGYKINQSNMVETLEKGTYNCASSAVMFQLMTHKLNIKTETVTLPRHVFCRIGRMDFETTNGKIVLATERKARYEKSRLPEDSKPGAPYEKVISRETNDLGLLALLYFNEGSIMAQSSKNPDYGTVVIKQLKAACLDKNNPWISVNLEKNFRNWFNSEISKKRFREAKWVADFYKKVIREESYANEFFSALATAKTKAGIKQSASIARKN